MADILFYDDNSVAFGEDDTDFGQENSHLESDDDNIKSSVLSHSYSSDCLHPNMSCGMIDSRSCCYSSSNWLTKSESCESFDSRLESMLNRVAPDYHEEASDNSMTLEDIRSQFNSCKSCGVSWSDNHVSLDCKECGGYSLSRPCPMCDGKCEAQWRRDSSMSHRYGKAHWEGECQLPEEDLPAIPSFLVEDVLIQGIEDLSTSS